MIVKLRDGWVVNVFGATLRSSRRLASNADTKFLGGYQFVLALLKCLVTFLHIASYWSCWAVIDDPCCLEMVYHALKGFVLQLNGLLGPLGAHKWFTKAPRSHSKFNNECPDLFRFFSIFTKSKTYWTSEKSEKISQVYSVRSSGTRRIYHSNYLITINDLIVERRILELTNWRHRSLNIKALLSKPSSLKELP